MEPEGTLPCTHEHAVILTRSRTNPVHSLPLYFFMTSFNLILTSTPKCRNLSLPSAVPPNLFALLFYPQTYHLSSPSHSPRFGPQICLVQVLNVSFMLLSPVSCYFLPRRSRYSYLPQYPILEHSRMFFS